MNPVLQQLRDELALYKENLLDTHSSWPHRLIMSVTYMKENIYEKTLISQGIQENCYGKNKNFSSEFRSYTGVSPKEYIQEFRIEAGKRVLSDKRFQSLRIYEIARALGYSGFGAFSHAFKKRVGDSPDIWRKEKLQVS